MFHAKNRAKASGVPFDITRDYLISIFPADNRCPVLGIELQWGGGYTSRDNSPSLDRHIPSLGYVPGNLTWISNRANTLKRNGTIEEMEAVLSFMKRPPIHGIQ